MDRIVRERKEALDFVPADDAPVQLTSGMRLTFMQLYYFAEAVRYELDKAFYSVSEQHREAARWQRIVQLNDMVRERTDGTMDAFDILRLTGDYDESGRKIPGTSVFLSMTEEQEAEYKRLYSTDSRPEYITLLEYRGWPREGMAKFDSIVAADAAHSVRGYRIWTGIQEGDDLNDPAVRERVRATVEKHWDWLDPTRRSTRDQDNFDRSIRVLSGGRYKTMGEYLGQQ